VRRVFAVLAMVLSMCAATPGAQTRESPLTGRLRPPPRWTRFVPPAVTAADIGGVSALVIVEVLVDPAGKVAEAAVCKAPPEIVDAVLAAVKQWEYTPHVVDGKAVWIRLVSSVQIRPMDGAPGAADAALGVPVPAASAAATSTGTSPRGRMKSELPASRKCHSAPPDPTSNSKRR
jgi:hypothetical protein